MDLSFENPEAGKAAEIFIDWLHAWEHMGDKSKRPLFPHGVFFLAQGNRIVPLLCRGAEELPAEMETAILAEKGFHSSCLEHLEEGRKKGYTSYPEIERLRSAIQDLDDELKTSKPLSYKAEAYYDRRRTIKRIKRAIEDMEQEDFSPLNRQECLHWLDDLLKALDNWIMSECFE